MAWSETEHFSSDLSESKAAEKKRMFCMWCCCILEGVSPRFCLSVHISFLSSQPAALFDINMDSVQFATIGWNSHQKAGATLQTTTKIKIHTGSLPVSVLRSESHRTELLLTPGSRGRRKPELHMLAPSAGSISTDRHS